MDFIIIGAAVLLALIGLIRGGAKMFFGIFMLLIIMVVSAFISAAICPLFLKSEKADGSIEYTSAATLIMDPVKDMISVDGDILDIEVEKKGDTLYLGDVPLDEAVGEGVPVVGPYLAVVVNTFANPGETLRITLAYKIAEYAYELVLWIILVIILAIIRNIFRKKIYRYLDHHPGPSKIDHLLGVVLNLVILLVLFWGVGTLVAYFDSGDNLLTDANAFLTQGVIAQPFMEANPLLKLLGSSGGATA